MMMNSGAEVHRPITSPNFAGCLPKWNQATKKVLLHMAQKVARDWLESFHPESSLDPFIGYSHG